MTVLQLQALRRLTITIPAGVSLEHLQKLVYRSILFLRTLVVLGFQVKSSSVTRDLNTRRTSDCSDPISLHHDDGIFNSRSTRTVYQSAGLCDNVLRKSNLRCDAKGRSSRFFIPELVNFLSSIEMQPHWLLRKKVPQKIEFVLDHEIERSCRNRVSQSDEQAAEIEDD
jgi:hypothetical protein